MVVQILATASPDMFDSAKLVLRSVSYNWDELKQQEEVEYSRTFGASDVYLRRR